VLYSAAIDKGFTAETVFIDEPVSYIAGPNQPPYQPLNYDRKFEGPVTLRHALEDSRNIPAVKALEAVGPEQVVGYAKRLGLTGQYPPYLSLALGAAESTLVEMTSAYSAFANQGVRMTPYAVRSVSDREGTVIEENRPEPHEALRADTAYLMAHLLEGVVLRGTAEAAKSLQWPLAGKTGTMDEFTDAWFVGFDPNITVGVWVGYDEKKPLGRGETGAQAALPIWMDFMRVYIDKRTNKQSPPKFEAPGNIIFVTLPSGITEAFINGTQPAGLTPDPPATQPAATPAPAPNRRRRRRRLRANAWPCLALQSAGLVTGDRHAKRRITGFTTDDEGHWVAELECGHRQHMRHRPPFESRQWVTTPRAGGAVWRVRWASVATKASPRRSSTDVRDRAKSSGLVDRRGVIGGPD
jgi:membrane carboxypeptidase/penicillin-binding protein